MLRDNLVGLIEPMRIQKQASDDRSSCLENPRPAGPESSLTENVTSPFQAEPAHNRERRVRIRAFHTFPSLKNLRNFRMIALVRSTYLQEELLDLVCLFLLISG